MAGGAGGAPGPWPRVRTVMRDRPAAVPAVLAEVPAGRPLSRQVVALGGGHGLFASLSALRRVTRQLTAIVTVADDGGSSGTLRLQVGVLAPCYPLYGPAALCGELD